MCVINYHLKFSAGSRSTSPASRFPARVPPRSQMSSRTVIKRIISCFINWLLLMEFKLRQIFLRNLLKIG